MFPKDDDPVVAVLAAIARERAEGERVGEPEDDRDSVRADTSPVGLGMTGGGGPLPGPLLLLLARYEGSADCMAQRDAGEMERVQD